MIMVNITLIIIIINIIIITIIMHHITFSVSISVENLNDSINKQEFYCFPQGMEK